MTDRPLPPGDLSEEPRHPERFVPAPDVWEWATAVFVDRGASLHNPEHGHLSAARVGVLWTNAPNSRHMRQIVGMAEVPGQGRGSKWSKARESHQLREWFDTGALDFLITLDAVWAARATDAAFCALVEHEMYHCGQRRDQYGAPKFHKDGRPVYGIRGHDVEEFVGVIRRYGAKAAGRGVQDIVAAGNKDPEVAPADIGGVCGVCS